MAARDEKPWDPYETCQKRDFIYRANATTEGLRYATSQAYRNSYSLSGPVGSTAYTEDFCWKLTSKPECIRTGSASGQRRNNPHPSESFMVWRLPKSSIRSSADRRALPIEEEIQKALTAQYCSTYRTDFLGIPQGLYHIHNTEGQLAPSHSRHQGPQMFTDTEMRHSYRQREQIPAMQGNKTRYGSNCIPCVPSGLQSNICNQRVKRLDMTTYDMFFGKKTSDVTSVLESLQPQSLQQLCRTLPEKGKELVHTHLSRAAHVNHGEKLKTLPPIPHTYHSGYQVLNEQSM